VRCYMIRHGEILSNIKKMYAGLSEESLTAKGEEQARLLARRLEGRGIRLIYSSPLTRAVETSEILKNHLELNFILEKELREIIVGPLEGLSYEQLIARFPEVWKTWCEAPADLRLEGMEPLKEVQKRILALMRQWLKKHKSETIAAVTHMGVLRCTLLYSAKRPLNDYRKIDIPNAAALCFELHETNPADGLDLRLVEEIHGE